jgi:hypothetical protein
MKLELNRKEEMTGLIFKKPRYVLDVNLEVSPEEMQLIKKHQWDKVIMAKGTMATGVEIDWTVGNMARKNSYPFKHIENLADFEAQVIESAKKLKRNIEAASGFTKGGPREVEL